MGWNWRTYHCFLSSWMEQRHCSQLRQRNYFDQYRLQPKSGLRGGDLRTSILLGPKAPWTNRAESAVRLWKAQLKIMPARLSRATLKKLTHRQLAKAAATVRNQTVTYGGVTVQHLAFGRRPADLIQLDVATPTQLTIDWNEEELTAIQIKQLSKQAFQEAPQSKDIRDLAQNFGTPITTITNCLKIKTRQDLQRTCLVTLKQNGGLCSCIFPPARRSCHPKGSAHTSPRAVATARPHASL